MTITITKAGVIAWLLAATSAVLLTAVLLLVAHNDSQSAHIATQNKTIDAANNRIQELASEVVTLRAKIGSAGSAPMGAAHGGIWDTVVLGKQAVAIITSGLVLDKAATSDERYEKFVAFINSVADKTDSKLIDLIAAHGTNPSKETFKPLLDYGLQK